MSSRDRLLAAMFAFQLVVAAVLGGVLVHALRDSPTTTTLTQSQPAAPGSGAVPTPSSTPIGASASAGTGPTTVTTTSGGGKGPAGAVTGPAPADTKVVAAGAPIKVGAIVTQTGAINFASSAQATKAYFDKVNRAGGVNGHKIVLDMRDDQLDPARGRQQAQQLVAGGVFAFTGWNAPLTENGITSFLAQNKIPLIGGYGEQEEYHSPYSYIFSATYGHYGFQMGSYLAEQGVKKPGLVFITNNSTKADDGLKAAFKAGFKAKGVTLSDSEIVSVDPTKPSYDDVVTQFKLDGVDGFASLLDQTAYNRLNQAQDRQAFHPKHAASPLFVDPTVRQSASTDGTFVATDYDFIEGGGPAVQEYATTVKAAFGSRAQINYFGEQGWVDAKAFVAALTQLGTTITRDALLKTMDKLDGRGGFGFTSDLKFGSGVRDLNRCVKLGKMVSGKVTRVTDWRCDEQPF
ncbi:MAG: branched-chain amino acid transport system substrate-binding protein [Actinomycetota bacterium]|nr:branched-chain amino acid transport system substrate-binding protein [Actinomycetota bacterium]